MAMGKVFLVLFFQKKNAFPFPLAIDLHPGRIEPAIGAQELL